MAFFFSMSIIKDHKIPYFITWAIATFEIQAKTRYEQRQDISNNVVCATSKASDQPAHTYSLIKAFASRLNILWVCGCTGLSESTIIKLPHCWKSHVAAHMLISEVHPIFNLLSPDLYARRIVLLAYCFIPYFLQLDMHHNGTVNITYSQQKRNAYSTVDKTLVN